MCKRCLHLNNRDKDVQAPPPASRFTGSDVEMKMSLRLCVWRELIMNREQRDEDDRGEKYNIMHSTDNIRADE